MKPLLLVALTLMLAQPSCRPSRPTLPPAPPNFTGSITGRAFNQTATGPRGLSRLVLRAPAPTIPPVAHVRVDSITRFIDGTGRGLAWDLTGDRAREQARVRVWFRGGVPTSITNVELWADADLVVIDSVQ